MSTNKNDITYNSVEEDNEDSLQPKHPITLTTTTTKNNNNNGRIKYKNDKRTLIHWFCLSGPLSVLFYALHDIIGGRNYPGYDWKRQAVSDLTAKDAPSFVVASSYSSIYGLFNGICCTLLCLLMEKSEKERSDSKNGHGYGHGLIFRLGIYTFALMNFVSAIGYSLFPLTGSGYDGSFQSFVHVYIVTVAVVLLSIISLILIAVGSFKGNEFGNGRGKDKDKDKDNGKESKEAFVEVENENEIEILERENQIRNRSKKCLGGLAILAFLFMMMGAIGSGLVPKRYFGVVERWSTYSAVVFTGILGIYGFLRKI